MTAPVCPTCVAFYMRERDEDCPLHPVVSRFWRDRRPPYGTVRAGYRPVAKNVAMAQESREKGIERLERQRELGRNVEAEREAEMHASGVRMAGYHPGQE